MTVFCSITQTGSIFHPDNVETAASALKGACGGSRLDAAVDFTGQKDVLEKAIHALEVVRTYISRPSTTDAIISWGLMKNVGQDRWQ